MLSHTVSSGTLSGTSSIPGATVPGSLLVGPNNAASHSATYFAVVPAADVRLGYGLTDRVRVNVGYSFLYWSQVQRAADQIDLAQPPAYTARTTDYWVQGWTMGVEVRY